MDVADIADDLLRQPRYVGCKACSGQAAHDHYVLSRQGPINTNIAVARGWGSVGSKRVVQWCSVGQCGSPLGQCGQASSRFADFWYDATCMAMQHSTWQQAGVWVLWSRTMRTLM
jgi:hypothetical protein